MKYFLSIILAFSANVFAAPNSPDNFGTSNTQATFVDFQDANYEITYDINQETVLVKSTIKFTQLSPGKPIFDLVPTASKVKINGKNTRALEISSPGKTTNYKLVDHMLQPGNHTLEIINSFDANIRFEKGGVLSAFWMSDLSDRSYLEQYIPTNIEFDQFKMRFLITFKGMKKKQDFFTNGIINKIGKNQFEIIYPSYFTTSSVFFHTSVKNRFNTVSFDYKSINGNTVPVIIYAKSSWSLGSAESKTKKVLTELEGKFGAWSHPSLTVYIAGMGGMEHSGATMTSMSALGHEITHSYFARGVMPKDGNAGWLDEAIASWRDGGYKSTKKPNFNSTAMAAHSQYRRTTDRKAYTEGANFMAYLNDMLKNVGGLEAFLSEFYNNYTHKSVTTELFRNKIEAFSGLNLEADFNKYIYGEEKRGSEKSSFVNPMHPKLTKAQLESLL